MNLLSSFNCKPSSNKNSQKMLQLSINPRPVNLQTRFRILFAEITYSFNIFCALSINDKIKTSFTLLQWKHCHLSTR